MIGNLRSTPERRPKTSLKRVVFRRSSIHRLEFARRSGPLYLLLFVPIKKTSLKFVELVHTFKKKDLISVLNSTYHAKHHGLH